MDRICSLWEQILSFKRSSHLKREAIEENHCLIQQSPLDVGNFLGILVSHYMRILEFVVSAIS